MDLKTIGLFALIQFPFTWKFIWAPLFDRFSFGMGRRRGWLIIFQFLLLTTICCFGFLEPKNQVSTVAIISIIIAFTATITHHVCSPLSSLLTITTCTFNASKSHYILLFRKQNRSYGNSQMQCYRHHYHYHSDIH